MPKPKKPKKISLLARSNMPEPMAAASPDRDLCLKCGGFRETKTPFARPAVPLGWTKELLVVMDTPEEHKALRPLLQEAGYSSREVAVANAVRCPIKEPTMEQIRCCRPFLISLVKDLAPRAVLGAGPVAARALTNDGQASVTPLRGRVLEAPGFTETYTEGGQDNPQEGGGQEVVAPSL